MELLNEISVHTGAIGVYALVFVLVLLVVLLPLSAYSTQKWTYRTYLETKSINARLGEILELAQAAQSRQEQPDEVYSDEDAGRREPTMGKDLNIPL